MKLLISLIISTICLLVFDKKIKKYAVGIYVVTVIIGVSTAIIPGSVYPQWLHRVILNYITRGTLATSLFIIVMYAILMPPKSKLQKTFMMLRGEVAIIASLLIVSHSIYYGKKYFVILFTNPSGMNTVELVAAIASLVMIILMIPLTITSFKFIRKKMNAKKWKKLQKWSYVFYAFIYFHVVILFSKHVLAGSITYAIDLCIYTIIFLLYTILRIRKALVRKNKIKVGNMLSIFGTGIVLFICIGILQISFRKSGNEIVQVDSEEVTIQSYKDGTWVGEGMGYNGKITIEVVTKDGKIKQITLLESEDDYEYLEMAEDKIIKEIIDLQTVDVDVVSGATYSSKGIVSAVKNALSNALE